MYPAIEFVRPAMRPERDSRSSIVAIQLRRAASFPSKFRDALDVRLNETIEGIEEPGLAIPDPLDEIVVDMAHLRPWLIDVSLRCGCFAIFHKITSSAQSQALGRLVGFARTAALLVGITY